MVAAAKTHKELLDEIQSLRQRLEETEETLRAIRAGEVDALVVDGSEGEQIFTLQGADHPYRLMVERMNEGALTVNQDGTIVYCNESFARMLGRAHRRVVGSNIAQYLTEDDFAAFAALIGSETEGYSKAEISLQTAERKRIPVIVSISLPQIDDAVCMVVTDLSEHKHNQELIVSQQLAEALHEQSEAARNRMTQILESITDAFMAFDSDWRVTAVNQQAATKVFARSREEVMGKVFWELYPQAVDTVFHREYLRAKREREVAHFEAASLIAPGKWFEVHAYPDTDGLSVYIRDITERKQSEQERERLLAREQALRSEAETANRLKDEFLATVSHELRTPLNAILGWATLLRRGNVDEDTSTRALEVVERNAKAQAQLIEDLLDVSRMMSGTLRLEVEQVDLVNIIKAAVDSIQPVAHAKGVRLEMALDTAAVHADAHRLQQVVWNVLSNAVKFTPKGGCVRIKSEITDSKVRTTISDTGEGIDPQFLPYLFEPFRQADGTITRREGGLGLGLAIAHRIVEMHCGTISATSAGKGLGATFTLSIPLALVRQSPMRRAPSDEAVQPNLSGIRILAVDDEPDTRDMLKGVLAQYGAEVMAAGSAEEAFAARAGWKPDILVCDIGMPEEDGYTLIQKLRRLEPEQGGNTPAIALTGYARVEDRMRALAAGYQMFVPKPVEAHELAVTIANLIGHVV